ncbi:MAG: hypothetical protein ACYCV6_02595 [Steroidobacteraceae bacterium]
MLSAGVPNNDDRCLMINGRSFDAIGFAVDRRNLPQIRKLCSALKLPTPWRAAVRDWARSSAEFLVMFADAAAYDEGVPSVMVADSEHEFELSIHSALSGVLGRTFYWNSCLDKPHEAQLRLALYIDTHLSGSC